MREETKIKEARFFYSHMVLQTQDRQAFLYYLSAFLSASRSALQYASKEAKSNIQGQKWYDGKINSSKYVTFFKGKRDLNIHERPIQVSQRSSASIADTIHISENVVAKLVDQAGKVTTVHSSGNDVGPEQTESSTSIKTLLVFRGWTGREDAIELCEKYLAELEQIILDGKKRGFLTV